MGRIRTIKPELPQDERVGRVSREARLCWLLCFTLADDEGRFRAHPSLLAGTLYPYDGLKPSTVAGWMDELGEAGLLIRYQDTDGQEYAEIHNWRKHQFIPHPANSRLPASPASSHENLGEPRRTTEVLSGSQSRAGARIPGPRSISLPDPRDRDRALRFTEVWNLNCAPLPTMRKAPVRRDPLSLVAGCMAGFDDDEGALAAAIRRAALEPFYREHAYGFETFCRKADRFTADPVTPTERREP